MLSTNRDGWKGWDFKVLGENGKTAWAVQKPQFGWVWGGGESNAWIEGYETPPEKVFEEITGGVMENGRRYALAQWEYDWFELEKEL
jgi:hypothetical protein